MLGLLGALLLCLIASGISASDESREVRRWQGINIRLSFNASTLYQFLPGNGSSALILRSLGRFDDTNLASRQRGRRLLQLSSPSNQLSCSRPNCLHYHYSFDSLPFSERAIPVSGRFSGIGTSPSPYNATGIGAARFGTASAKGPNIFHPLETCENGATTLSWVVLDRYASTQNVFGSILDTSDFTVSFWFNVLDMPLATQADQQTDPCGLLYVPTVWEEASNGLPMFRAQVFMKKLLVVPFYVGMSTVTVTDLPDLQNNHWYHVIVRWSWSAQRMNVLLDGSVLGSYDLWPCTSNCETPMPTNYSYPTTGAIFNTQWPGWSSFTASFTGLVDELWMHNKYLSDDEVDMLRNFNTLPVVCEAGQYAAVVDQTGQRRPAPSLAIATTCGMCVELGRLGSLGNTTQCTNPCAPNFAIGLNPAVQHRVQVDMTSSTRLTQYDSSSQVSDMTLSLWFNLERDGFQYLASKDSSWYLKVTGNNTIAFRILPYMPFYLVNQQIVSNRTWHHVAVTVKNSFSYSNYVQFNTHQSDYQLSSSSGATVALAAASGFSYVRNSLQVTLYVNGAATTTSMVWLSNSMTRFVTDSVVNSLQSDRFFSFPVGNPAPAFNNPINFGACMKTYSASNSAVRSATRALFIRNTTAYGAGPEQIPCSLVPFVTGSYANAPMSSPKLHLDDLALYKAALTYYDEIKVAAQKQYVINNFINVDYSSEDLDTLSGSTLWSNQHSSLFETVASAYPFLNASDPRSATFDTLGFFGGLMDEIALFNISLTATQISSLRGQIIAHPTKQKMSEALNDGTMNSLMLLLQFEEPWQSASMTTGTVGLAALLSASGPTNMNNVAHVPLHVNDGPLCYPSNGLAAGLVPSWLSMGSVSLVTAIQSSVQCDDRSSNWPGSYFCYECPSGFLKSGNVCEGNSSMMALRSGLRTSSSWFYGVNYIVHSDIDSITRWAPIELPGLSNPPAVQYARVPVLFPTSSVPMYQANDEITQLGQWRNVLRVLRGQLDPSLNSRLVNGSYSSTGDNATLNRRLLAFHPCILGGLVSGLLTYGGVGITTGTILSSSEQTKESLTIAGAVVTSVSGTVGVVCGVHTVYDYFKKTQSAIQSLEQRCANLERINAERGIELQRVNALQSSNSGVSSVAPQAIPTASPSPSSTMQVRFHYDRRLLSCDESGDNTNNEEKNGEDDSNGDGDGDGGKPPGGPPSPPSPPPPPPPPPPIPPIPPMDGGGGGGGGVIVIGSCPTNQYWSTSLFTCVNCPIGQWSIVGDGSCRFGFTHWNFDMTLTDVSNTYAGTIVPSTGASIGYSASSRFGGGALSSTCASCSQWITLPNLPLLGTASGLASDWSVAAWVRPTDSSAMISILYASSGSGVRNFQVLYETKRSSIKIMSCNPAIPTECKDYYISAIVQLCIADDWCHIAFTFKSGSPLALSAYLNGQQAGSWDVSADVNVQGLQWKIGYDDEINSFNGIIDELWVFNRTLSQSQITTLHTTNTFA